LKRHIAISCPLVVVFLIAFCVSCATTPPKSISVYSPSAFDSLKGNLNASAIVGEHLVLLIDEGLAVRPLSSLAAEAPAADSKAIDTYIVGSKNACLLQKGKRVYFGGESTLGWASIGDDGKINDRGSIALLGGVSGLASEADRLYVLSGTALLTYRLGDTGFPASSESESSQRFSGRALGLDSKPGMLAAAIYCYGVDFYDLGDPSNPRLAKSVRTGGCPTPRGLFYRDYYIFSNDFRGFQAIDTKTFAQAFTFYEILSVGASVYRSEDTLYFASASGRGVWKLDGTAIPSSGEIPKKAIFKMPISNGKGYLSSDTTGIASLFRVSGKLYGLQCKNKGRFFQLDEKVFKASSPEILESVAPGLRSKEDAAMLFVTEGFTVSSLNGRPVSFGITAGDDRSYRVVYVPEGRMDISYTYRDSYFSSKGTLKASRNVRKGGTYVLALALGMSTTILDMDSRSGR
jgi:hypothetical protein